jgi:hypothetical protein
MPARKTPSSTVLCLPLQLHLQERQLCALQTELSGGCTLLQGPDRGPYAALSPRSEQADRAAGWADLLLTWMYCGLRLRV